jgi:ribosome biogenesis GTPase / thiamine phosphate phosphatase
VAFLFKDFKMQGLVLKKSQGMYVVRVDGQPVTCSMSSKLRKKLIYPIADMNDPKRKGKRVERVDEIDVLDPVAVGDQVLLTDAGDGTAHITEVLPRRNELSRAKAEKTGGHTLEQVLVANMDQVVAVFPVHPDPRWHLLDRYLVMAESAGIPAVICLTKLDKADDVEALQAVAGTYERLGYPTVLTSALTHEGIVRLKTLLQGRVSALMGKSGVGKTTLLNAVQPELGLRVNAVNTHTGEGRHTTTHLEMFDLEGGGSVVDTPGLRLFKIWGADTGDLALLLPEMRPLVGKCKFGLGCTHQHEPNCAIRNAVSSGAVSEQRYASYLDMKAYFEL